MSEYLVSSGTLPPHFTSYAATSSGSHYEGFNNHEPSPHVAAAAAHSPLTGGNGRSAFPHMPATHITLNPYSSQLVDNINRMMMHMPAAEVYEEGRSGGHVYQAAMSPQLSQLTNTLRKKKCLGLHPGPCHHNNHLNHHHRLHHHHNPDTTPNSSERSSVVNCEPDTETETVAAGSSSAAAADVVFRAVSPHGHVYWEIEPRRTGGGGRLAGDGSGRLNAAGGDHLQSDSSDTNNDIHNMSDLSEEDAKVLSDRASRHCSGAGRFADHQRPAASAGGGHLATLPENPLSSPTSSSPSLIQFSPAHHQFTSLQRPASVSLQRPAPLAAISTAGSHATFSSSRPPRMRQVELALRAKLSSDAMAQEGAGHDAAILEQVQQQVTIPDLRRIPVHVKSSEYIMAKIQTHMDQQRKQHGSHAAADNAAADTASSNRATQFERKV